MSFDAAWLDLREPADLAARDPRLLAAAAAHLAGAERPVALDLGAGTGATVRAFAGRAPAGTRWRLVDSDPALLALAAARAPGAEAVQADIGDLDALPFAGVRLVTASALLDLAPGDWLEALAARAAAAGCAVYAALTYDGTMQWAPDLPDDAAVRAAFNAHQRRDKGLGPALGPDAAETLAAALRRQGYSVRTAPSPWRLEPAQAALQRALVAGIAGAAAEQGLDAAAWGQARRAASGSARCTVGHTDLLALPAAASAQSKITSDASP